MALGRQTTLPCRWGGQRWCGGRNWRWRACTSDSARTVCAHTLAAGLAALWRLPVPARLPHHVLPAHVVVDEHGVELRAQVAEPRRALLGGKVLQEPHAQVAAAHGAHTQRLPCCSAAAGASPRPLRLAVRHGTQRAGWRKRCAASHVLRREELEHVRFGVARLVHVLRRARQVRRRPLAPHTTRRPRSPSVARRRRNMHDGGGTPLAHTR